MPRALAWIITGFGLVIAAHGLWTRFRPISATLLGVSAVFLAVLIFPAIRRKREEALQE